jgi:hypothetical protein
VDDVEKRILLTVSRLELRSRPYSNTFYILFIVVVQTGPGVHPTSYPMGTGGSFPGGEAAGV